MSLKDTAETEAWESGKLGRDEEFARKSNNDGENLDDKLGLQMISITLQESLIEDLTNIAKLNGMGSQPQPLIKKVLERFVDTEKTKILREVAMEQRSMEAGLKKETLDSSAL
ncbi:hypothetical protein [Vibrio sp. D431a]|uniref:hypothetical protein n=1 Tax=Vibrio sp. D431a TaxID=2837388 RepID=UPI002553B64D|nr:hypothetical protein [Vibrio sp. D431a]MDK9793743.1 hypothetical protein [Vibrio sp. D431a]